MLRKFEVSVVVEIDDPFPDDWAMERETVATAIAEAAQVLTHWAEDPDNPNVGIYVNEVP